MTDYKILATKPSADYELLDSGDGEKLERYGKFVISRPDPQALWPKNLSIDEWNKADAIFEHASNQKEGWKTKNNLPEKWPVKIGDLTFKIHLGTFKHTGIFPEHLSNWQWLEEQIKKANRPVSVLNLFGYTGAATLACAKAGAEVCHVDGSKVAVSWAKENAELSGLSEKKIRWIIDDVAVFVNREIKRGHHYDGIIMDPPAFGHGPKKEVWKIEKDLVPLLKACEKLLTPKPLFFAINGYAAGYSAIAYENNLKSILNNLTGEFEKGELTIQESGAKRLLPCGIFARWSGV
jgi:23S rRNA (cytosine1962-C5)-methyltransferase